MNNNSILHAYMVVNLRSREISRGARKLTRRSMLIIKKNNSILF